MAAIGEFFFGSPARQQQFQKFTPQQQGVQNQILQQLLQMLQGGAGMQPNYTGFAPIEQQARTQFQTNTIPSLAERFTAMGNGQRSSAFQAALGQAGAGLEQGLGALKSQYGLQQQGLQQRNLANLLNFGFQPSFENAYFPSSPGLVQNLFSGLSQGAGQGIGAAGSAYALGKFGLL